MSRLMREAATLERMRRWIGALILLGLLGTLAELLLVNHVEDVWQWAPVVLMSIAVPALLWLMFAPAPAAVRVWQTLMFAFIISGGIGLWLHWQAKMEFKRETNPTLAGVQLFWQSLKSVSPPALAPGVMIQLGLLGFACAYRHPALGRVEENSNVQGETK